MNNSKWIVVLLFKWQHLILIQICVEFMNLDQVRIQTILILVKLLCFLSNVDCTSFTWVIVPGKLIARNDIPTMITANMGTLEGSLQKLIFEMYFFNKNDIKKCTFSTKIIYIEVNVPIQLQFIINMLQLKKGLTRT